MKKALASLALLGALALTACGGPTSAASGGTQTPVAPVTAPTPKETVIDTGEKSVRGNTVKKLGETAHFTSMRDDTKVIGQFAIQKIEEINCTQQYAQPPKNGKVIALTIDLSTSPDLAKESFPKIMLGATDFKYISPNGTTFNGALYTPATYGCVDQSQILQPSYGPSEKAHGLLILDVPKEAGGTLVAGHVEWNLP